MDISILNAEQMGPMIYFTTYCRMTIALVAYHNLQMFLTSRVIFPAVVVLTYPLEVQRVNLALLVLFLKGARLL